MSVFLYVYNISVSFFFPSHLESEVANRKAQLTACQRHLYSIQNEIRRNEDHLHRHRQHQKELQVKIGVVLIFRC